MAVGCIDSKWINKNQKVSWKIESKNWVQIYSKIHEALSPRIKFKSIWQKSSIKYTCDKIKGVYGAQRKESKNLSVLKLLCFKTKSIRVVKHLYVLEDKANYNQWVNKHTRT